MHHEVHKQLKILESFTTLLLFLGSWTWIYLQVHRGDTLEDVVWGNIEIPIFFFLAFLWVCGKWPRHESQRNEDRFFASMVDKKDGIYLPDETLSQNRQRLIFYPLLISLRHRVYPLPQCQWQREQA